MKLCSIALASQAFDIEYFWGLWYGLCIKTVSDDNS